MPRHPFHQIDVFSSTPYLGNAVAVLSLSRPPSAATQQRIARWTNLSETVFLLPPGSLSPSSAAAAASSSAARSSSNDGGDGGDEAAGDEAAGKGKEQEVGEAHFAVLIWTPELPLPFAGHPTLGAARAWLELNPSFAGRELRMQCGIGTVRIRVERRGEDASGASDESASASGASGGPMLYFEAPPLLRSGAVDSATVQRACAAMSLPRTCVLGAEWIANGPPWFALRLASPEAVRGIGMGSMGKGEGLMWGVCAEVEERRMVVRTFAPSLGVVEDPVTGSFTAGLARSPLSPAGDFVVEQGEALGREGRIVVRREKRGEEEEVWVGGETNVCFTGEAEVGDE